jgi:hypothetical protein
MLPRGNQVRHHGGEQARSNELLGHAATLTAKNCADQQTCEWDHE